MVDEQIKDERKGAITMNPQQVENERAKNEKIDAIYEIVKELKDHIIELKKKVDSKIK